MLTSSNYNPDVLTCLANLSSDEVFTPPKLVNEILDLLPPEIWNDKNARFLDPSCKSLLGRTYYWIDRDEWKRILKEEQRRLGIRASVKKLLDT